MADNRNGAGQPAGGKGSGGGASPYLIQLDTFSKRLKLLYSNWNEQKADLWGSADVIAIATPPESQDLRYLKSSALNMWLLGFEFPETIMVFMKRQIHFLCTQKKASVLEVVKKSAKEAVGVDIVMHVKAKSDDGISLMDAILSAISTASKGEATPVVGYPVREAPEGRLLENWIEKLKSANVQLTDVTNGLSDLFAIKDDGELLNIKKAAHLTANVMKNYVVPKFEFVIDEEKKVSHSSLMEDTEKAIQDPSKAKVKLKAENVDICYPPIFQSGGKFDLRPSAASNDELLYYDSASVIICALGSRYNSYCSNIARTFLGFVVAVAFLAVGVIFSPETFGSEEGGGGGLGKLGTALRLAHLLCFATAWGAALWVTFIGGIIMFKNLPRHMFGNLQSKMFPAYFAMVGFCCAISLASFGYLHPWKSASTAEKYQLGFLASSFAFNLTNLVVFTPMTIQMMKQRHKVEREENIGEEIGWSKNVEVAKVNPKLAAMNKKFGMIHGLSSLANILSFGSLAIHSWYLAGKLNL